MPQNLSTTIIPSDDSQVTYEQRVNSVQFGSGYQQDFVTGINNEFEVWDLSYPLLSLTNYNTIKNVLSAAGSWDVINWTAPGGSAKKYKMDKAGYTTTRKAATYSLRFKLRQVF
jgi:phage-related protein